MVFLRRSGMGVLVLSLLCAGVPAAGGNTVNSTDTFDPTTYVNPLTGTAPGDPELNAKMGDGWGNGNTYPGATLPHGMTQWSPATPSAPPGGYSYEDTEITGFGLTHESGAGCPMYGDAPIMPVPEPPAVSPATDPARYHSGFRHDDERAAPGTYSVRLESGIEVRLAAALRGGAGAFTFPAGADATLLVDAGGSANGASAASVRILGDDTLVGQVTSGEFCGAPATYTLYFAYRFSRPFRAHGTWSADALTPGGRSADGQESGGWVTFDESRVEATAGISFTDAEGAMTNLETLSHDQVAAAAHRAWRTELGRIRVAGGREEDLRTFYTALYHVMLGPTVFSDADGRYRGFDDRVHHVRPGRLQYANFSGWDTYRTHMQLVALLDPRRASDMAQSLVDAAQQSGWLPRISFANRHTSVMAGDPSSPILAGALAFGARDFDTTAALAAMVRGATVPGDPATGYVPREGLRHYLDHGYLPIGLIDRSGAAGMTLEYTTSDFSIAQFAAELGDRGTAAEFTRRAQNWQHLLDPGTGSVAPRLADGSLLPVRGRSRMTGWVEGSQAQYAWMVPYNLDGLVTAAGGPEAVVARLDDHFAKLNEGSRSRHAFLGNEPNLVTPWVYHAAGAPWRTQEVVRRAQRELFSAQPDGLHGNDDLGAMSAWYVWTALGLFPAIPGRAELALTTPLFPKAVLQRGSGQELVIRAPRAPDAGYLREVTVNGRAHDRAYLEPDFVETGGVLDLRLGDTPRRDWASPGLPSFSEGQAPVTGAISGTHLRLQGFTDQPVTVNWALDPFADLTVTPSSGTVTIPAGGRVDVPLSVQAADGAAEGYRRATLHLSTADGKQWPAPTARLVVAPPDSLLRVADSLGVSADDRPEQADLNDYGGSYSAQLLAESGFTPGAEVVRDGVPFRWPAAAPGEPDNVVAHGQTIPLPGAQPGAPTLGFLGSALGGHGQGTGSVTYTDGSTGTFTLALSDWTLKGGSVPALPGNRVAADMPYRNYPAGPDHTRTYLFSTSAALDPAKTVASVTLPADVADRDLHVFAIGVGG
ncbi:GH92 family glycosyl hydrolase [Amycolatopsis magusensis]|uniref:Alpha-1,2-mannosidase n=1 Tax=Amycolatopsis magusensis TaxID=882444 RepID=A0ABS4PXH3_9PSEU|nr:GH92 family glycosyl hydrolase [Amycolatopsis magusensis]MBP2184018.1 putative alpha-1,2-mannosidase [Amycolatopsis magusensis]